MGADECRGISSYLLQDNMLYGTSLNLHGIPSNQPPTAGADYRISLAG